MSPSRVGCGPTTTQNDMGPVLLYLRSAMEDTLSQSKSVGWGFLSGRQNCEFSDRLSFKHFVFINLQTTQRLARYVLAPITNRKRVHLPVLERLESILRCWNG